MLIIVFQLKNFGIWMADHLFNEIIIIFSSPLICFYVSVLLLPGISTFFWGRETLIISVLTSIPLYAMHCFMLPPRIIQKVTSTIKHFWWKGITDTFRTVHQISHELLVHASNILMEHCQLTKLGDWSKTQIAQSQNSYKVNISLMVISCLLLRDIGHRMFGGVFSRSQTVFSLGHLSVIILLGESGLLHLMGSSM